MAQLVKFSLFNCGPIGTVAFQTNGIAEHLIQTFNLGYVALWFAHLGLINCVEEWCS